MSLGAGGEGLLAKVCVFSWKVISLACNQLYICFMLFFVLIIFNGKKYVTHGHVLFLQKGKLQR